MMPDLLLGWLRDSSQVFARRNIGNVGHARDLAFGGIVDADASMVE